MENTFVQQNRSTINTKLKKVLPDSIGQASRISGVTPAAVSLLLVHLKKQRVTINGY